MDQRRSLLVLRHAQTEEARPGRRDKERRLTPDGQRQATEAGDHLRTLGITVDTVLCSSAARARQTLELLKLDERRASGQVDVADRFYNAGTDTLPFTPRATRRSPGCAAHRTCSGRTG